MGGRDLRRTRDEAGAYLVLYALLAVAFCTMAAIVLDIAALRQGRRADRTAADLAASAGVIELDSTDPTTFAGACDAAWGYVLANRTEAGGGVTAPPCGATFPSGVACTALLPARTAIGTVGPLRIEITHPVPDASPLMLAEAQGGDIAQTAQPAFDGTACDRFGVRIVRDRNFLFGQIAGAIGGTTDVHAVARALTTTSTTEIPGVVVIERTGCGTLTTSAAGGELDVRGVGQAGVIIVDSDGSACGAGSYVVRPDPSGRIRALAGGGAPGLLASFALDGSSFASAYDPADVAGGRLSPTPSVSIARTGRALIDERYNCTSTSCAAGSDFIDQLEAADGGPGIPAGHLPYSDPCIAPAGPAGAPVVGSTYVDCPLFDVQGPVTFSGSSVVFAGDVVIRAGGCLAVNDTSCGGVGAPAMDGVVFVRGGLSKEPTGQLFLHRAFTYAVSTFDVPVDPAPPPDSAVVLLAPLGGPFEDLALWTETAGLVRLGEQDSTQYEGTVFAPSASALVLEARGGPGIDVPLQVVARDVRVDGDGDVTLRPSAGRATGRVVRTTRLIR